MVILWTYVFQLPSQVHTLMSNQGSVCVALFILGKSTIRVSLIFSYFCKNVWEFQVSETSTVSNSNSRIEQQIHLHSCKLCFYRKPE